MGMLLATNIIAAQKRKTRWCLKCLNVCVFKGKMWKFILVLITEKILLFLVLLHFFFKKSWVFRKQVFDISRILSIIPGVLYYQAPIVPCKDRIFIVASIFFFCKSPFIFLGMLIMLTIRFIWTCTLSSELWMTELKMRVRNKRERENRTRIQKKI